jgi:drug/metabolite transporter (DMT)-like permease
VDAAHFNKHEGVGANEGDQDGPPRSMLGVFLIVGSVFLMSFGDALIKYTSSSFTVWQMFTLRSVIAAPMLLVLLRVLGPLRDIKPKALGWVCLRSLLLVSMWIAYFAALPLISLSTAAVAFYTAPLFIALLSRTATGEPVGPVRWTGIMLGFAGVLIVLRPGTDAFSAATLLPVLAAIFYAAAAVMTRARCAEESALVLALGLNLGLLVAGVVASAGFWLAPPGPGAASDHPFLFGQWAAMGGREWALMALLALLMVAFGTGVAMAYQLAPAALVGTFDYAYVAFAVIWGYVLFAELPDAGAIAGMALIACAGVLVACVPPEFPALRSAGTPMRPG